MSEDKASGAKATSAKTYFFQIFKPEAIYRAIERADLDQVIQLVKTKKVSVDFVYGGSPPLLQSINLHKENITLFLLENHANPNAEFDFRAAGSRNGIIIQTVMDRNDLNNTQLLVLYGGVPPSGNLQADFATHVVATSASIDFKKRRELETNLASALKHEHMKKDGADLCEQLESFWEEQSKVNHQFPRGG